MKKVLFHNHSLTFRGVTNATVDYAEYNQSVLGNESVLIYNPSFNKEGLEIHTRPEVVDVLKKRFKLLEYTNEKELNDIASEYDAVYFQNSGAKEGPFVTSTKSLIHSVFQFHEPHGDVYAYISKWLSDYITGGKSPYVPLIVDMPPPHPRFRQVFRDNLKIPQDAYVFGRHGGHYTFDLRNTMQAVVDIVHKYKNVYFLFANTIKFYDHPQIIHVPPFFGPLEKSNFISTCDAMIHGRNLGESFGLSICEFLFHNKPVVAWEGGFDKNHVEILGSRDLLYSESNVKEKMLSVLGRLGEDYKSLVEPYNPNNVMKKFDEVFLK